MDREPTEPELASRRDTWIVFVAAFALFSTGTMEFEARQTDVSALRVLDGDVPYRDFWTMYAPGSFVVLAGAFAVFGRELIVSTILGVLTSAGAVAVLHRVLRGVTDRVSALAVSGLVGAAIFSTGYSDGFTSYPPTILLVLSALLLASRRCTAEGWRWAVAPGLTLGLAALFKHDVAAYGAIGIGAGTLVTRLRERISPMLSPVVALGAVAATLPLAAAALLVALEAGPDAWSDLFVFPMGDFEYVRGEYFPLVPTIQGSWFGNAFELRHWMICNAPTIALIVGLVALVRHRSRVSVPALLVTTAGAVAFAFHWFAAHVQLNTNAISLSLWGCTVGVVALHAATSPHPQPRRRLVVAALIALSFGFLAEPVYRFAKKPRATEFVGLDGLRGVRVTQSLARDLRGLSAAMAEAEPPDAPLLFVSNRNDIVVYVQCVPFWVSTRPCATRHHELHPGISDTEAVHRRMLADIARGPAPVVVREHRFGDETLDKMLAEFSRHGVPVGSGLLDAWLTEHYAPGPRFGMYEVMQRR